MLKTYETIGILNRHTVAVIDGNEIAIHFINGTEAPRRIQGRFTTTDKRIQDWLEKSLAFNVRWRLVSVQGKPEPEPEEVVGAELPKGVEEHNDDLAQVNNPPVQDMEDDKATPAMGVPEETEEGVLPEPDFEKYPLSEEENELNRMRQDITVVGEEVVNGQQARNYLIENFKELTFRQVQNNAQIIAEAKARNVQFTHWEAFVTSK